SSSPSDHLRRQADDAGKIPLPQFAGDGPEDAGALRVLVGVNNDHRVAVEADVTAVIPPGRLPGPHDHALDDVAGLHVAAGDRLLDAGDDDVADAGVPLAAAAQHLDAHAFLGAGVVGHVDKGIH